MESTSTNGKRQSKVDIRRICQKFENLNSVENNIPSSKRDKIKQDIHEKKSIVTPQNNSPPIVPIRKLKNRNVKTNFIITPNVNTAMDKSDANYNDHDHNNGVGIVASSSTVRERTKFFESTSSSNLKIVNQNTLMEDPSPNTVKVQLRNKLEETPPIKPPRMSYQSNSQSKKNENIAKRNTMNTFQTKNIPTLPKSQTSGNKPILSKCKSVSSKEKDEMSKLNCTYDSMPKPPVKISAISSYLKNFSNAQFHEKEKINSIFVDLTPTTVSPPKHYGTLKRSHSEEHIYAEPFESDTYENASQDKSPNELHYMCTPIVESPDPTQKKINLPLTDIAKRGPRFKKSAVRRVIYESFSMLRRPQRFEGHNLSEKDVDSESDVSLKDVEERTIYVKSIKKQMSVSSICTAPKLFESILIINISHNGPEVIHKYPEAPQRIFDYPLIPHLCFPDYACLEAASVYKSEMFHFTLIAGEDEKIFGYCHRILGWPEQSQGFCHKFPLAICILSSISAPLFYKKILAEIEKHLMLPLEECSKYLVSLRKLGVPNAGASVSIPDNTESVPKRVIITRPLDSHRIGIELTRTLQLLDVHIMMKAVSSLLLERRVLFLSRYSWNVLHCVSAISSLLYPFQWQHLLIPIVPNCLMVQCCTESPYLLGVVCSEFSNILDLLSEHELLIVDIDKGLVLKSISDEDTILPKQIHKAVIGAFSLAKNMTDPTEMMRDVMISEAAIHMFVEMLGHVADNVITQPKVALQKEAFQKNAPSRSIQSFLQWFSETQMFETFIDEYIWRINYRQICQSQQFTLFEKRVEEYKWQLAYDNDKISRKIGKTVKNIGERLKNFTKELL